MLFFPGWLIAMATFPGVVTHEIAHRFFCDLTGTSVYKICYFQRRNPSLQASFLISIGLLIVNTLFCSLLAFSAMIPVYVLKARDVNLIFYALLWVGFSIGMDAFPSNQDLAAC